MVCEIRYSGGGNRDVFRRVFRWHTKVREIEDEIRDTSPLIQPSFSQNSRPKSFLG